MIIVADEAQTVHASTCTDEAVKSQIRDLPARVDPPRIGQPLGDIAIRSDKTSRYDSKRDRPGRIAVTQLKRACPDVHLIECQILQKVSFGGGSPTRFVYAKARLQISAIRYAMKLLAICISAG